MRTDGVVTGSGNRAIYQSAAKSLIRQAMQGYDAVVFAYVSILEERMFAR